jgi:glyoxylase-like metal-dependent hydrolase (beta-lactamase superfamily II)
LAPKIFEDSGDHSFVLTQPRTPGEILAATRALLACPTGSIGSIGTLDHNSSTEVMGDFPLPIEDGVFYCGFNSPKSFGGNSYFIQHPRGNWLVDSPKFLPLLTRKFTEMGGIRFIFLTHQDDVAEAARYAGKFGSQRIIHEKDQKAQPGAEILLQGTETYEPVPEFRIIPTAGHTEGHCVLLYREKFLFTGDHLWWRRNRQQLGASQSVAWHSWRKQTESMARLLGFPFEWVLPGHGQRVKLDPSRMRRELEGLVGRMRASLEGAWK